MQTKQEFKLNMKDIKKQILLLAKDVDFVIKEAEHGHSAVQSMLRETESLKKRLEGILKVL